MYKLNDVNKMMIILMTALATGYVVKLKNFLIK